MARRIARLALVPALLLSTAPAAEAVLYCGIRLHAFCSRVCTTHPAVTERCEEFELPPLDR